MTATVTGATTTSRRPTALSAALAVVAALVGVILPLDADPARTALLVEVASLFVLAGGFALRFRDRSLAGAAVALAGVGGFVASVGIAVVRIDDLGVLVRLLPGMVGVFLLATGLIPVHSRASRALVKLGSGGVFVGVLLTGVFQAALADVLLPAGAAAIIAWDAGEHAINVGEHLGREAATARIELTHVAGTVLVGWLAVVAGRFVANIGSPHMPLASLVLLLVAVILLLAALHE